MRRGGEEPARASAKKSKTTDPLPHRAPPHHPVHLPEPASGKYFVKDSWMPPCSPKSENSTVVDCNCRVPVDDVLCLFFFCF